MCAVVSEVHQRAIKTRESHCVLPQRLRNDMITGQERPLVATQAPVWPRCGQMGCEKERKVEFGKRGKILLMYLISKLQNESEDCTNRCWERG